MRSSLLLLAVICAEALGELYDGFYPEMDASRCVAPSEYATCREKARNDMNACGTVSYGQSPCVCEPFAALLNCIGSYCWNNVYGCEYQSLAHTMIFNCPVEPSNFDIHSIPFNPAPDGAPGICSCNHGQTSIEYFEMLNTQLPACMNKTVDEDRVNLPGAEPLQKACNCCAVSSSFSAIIDGCPTTDFPLLRFNESNRFDPSTGNYSWFNCAASLDKYDCVKDLGFKAPLPDGNIYKPSNLPLPGTESMSNLGGQLTAPVSGWTYTWSVASKEFVVTAFSPSGTVISIPTASVASDGTATPGNSLSETTGTSSTSATTAPTSAANPAVLYSSSAFILLMLPILLS